MNHFRMFLDRQDVVQADDAERRRSGRSSDGGEGIADSLEGIRKAEPTEEMAKSWPLRSPSKDPALQH